LIFRETGHIRNGFYALGTSAVPVYLLDGIKPALFDAGFTCFGGLYRDAIQAVLGDRQPEYLFLTHSHFDHCGAGAQLKGAFPGMKAAASEKTGAVLKRPNAVKLIRRLNREVTEALDGIDKAKLVDIPFEPFAIDRVLEDGEVIELGGGLTCRVLHTPGHTWDYLSYYVPERKILIAPEAVGCANTTGYVVTESLVDFDAYFQSLRRLSRLDVEILCQGHTFVYLDGDVEDFFRRSTETALAFKALVERVWEEEGDLQKTVDRIKALEYDPVPNPKQPEPAYLLNLEARIKSIIRP
jgi:glyoxylase-like metal-dependent hydrolase (beta-lactamase superfamily II)